eukprot:CAMPEP_0198366988 /NCGR_PEP_ID=MMETSP1450-20131203/154957_1 /TAXON_ID=753684 ORGANISM="Madagascaria erythrocladiodes, Strain CCMP3234" /NCGR_SAMPLE_ID=MMETSP1450 /ASSEMBLY_ACC=CAM_ASM_001115 /LENGTH=224 /DNA_ID=CAMNT_0044074457 /DNA_START=291 /DNA_END=965 /DNA_ORIENTATION=+
MSEVHPLLQRYLDGDCQGVTTAMGEAPPEVKTQVARELAQRVRRNIERLIERWREHGYSFEDGRGVGQRGALTPVLDSDESQHGPLPAVLRAVYEELESVSFVQPATTDWAQQLGIESTQGGAGDWDPLLLLPFERAKGWVILFPDATTKCGFSGSGPMYIVLPEREDTAKFDCDILFEGGKMWSLVEYLRFAILETGGLCLSEKSGSMSTSLVQSLVEGLEPF